MPAEDGETDDEAQAREDRNNLLGIPDEQGRRRDGLADLLEEPLISKALLREGGRLDRLVASYYDETSRRDDSEEAFGEDDLPVRAAGIRRALSGRPDLAGTVGDGHRRPHRRALVARGRSAHRPSRRRSVCARTTGGDTLDGLFRRSRQILKSEGRELVLIFEDLTQFGLVDGELYDQFATAPSEDSRAAAGGLRGHRRCLRPDGQDRLDPGHRRLRGRRVGAVGPAEVRRALPQPGPGRRRRAPGNCGAPGGQNDDAAVDGERLRDPQRGPALSSFWRPATPRSARSRSTDSATLGCTRTARRRCAGRSITSATTAPRAWSSTSASRRT